MGKDGFTSGDFDPAFPLDDKFLVLAAVTPDRRTYYEATGVYWHVVAASWNAGRRMNVARTAPAASEGALKALFESGLLDPDGSLPGSSFNRWVGAAQARRAGWAERKRMERASAGVTETPRESHATSSSQNGPPERDVPATLMDSDGLSGTPPDSRGVTPRAQDRRTDRQVKTTSGGGAGEPTPKECKDPKAHRAEWVTFAGVGTRCPVCLPSDPLPAWTPPAP